MSQSFSFTNSQVAKLLSNVAAVMSLNGENIFRIKAFQNASSSIDGYPTQIVDLWKEGKLDDVPGLGKALRGDMEELFTTGKVKHFEEVMSTVPQGLFALMDIPGIGPKNGLKLATFFKLDKESDAIKRLYDHAVAGEISELEGFTAVGEKRIIDAIAAMRDKPQDRLPLPDALAIAAEVISYLQKGGDVIRAETLGSLRRRSPTTGDIDIAVATHNTQGVFELLKKYPHQKRIVGSGEKSMSVIHSAGWQVDVKTVDPTQWGSILQHFTGSKLHNIHLRTEALKKGLSLNEFGIEQNGKRESFDTEEKFYKKLGLQWVPPELREDTGEIELAKQNKLPTLLELSDIKGDFHIHTAYQFPTSHDLGQSTVDDILLRARELGYTAIGLSDHNPKRANLTAKERLTIVKDRNDHIREAAERFNRNSPSASSGQALKVYCGMEVDILPDGSLALEDEALMELDYVIASLHSSLTQERSVATQRILKAITHPLVTFMGHPTGQVLQERAGIDADWDTIFAAAAEHKKLMEINSSPSRTDLSSNLIKRAIEKGVKLIINTDSHHVSGMDLIQYGVWNARRGWATKKDIANTQTIKL